MVLKWHLAETLHIIARLDLHYLQTGDAISHLAEFLTQWQASLARKETVTLEIVTGRGNRSDTGKSRLRQSGALSLVQLPPETVLWLVETYYAGAITTRGFV